MLQNLLDIYSGDETDGSETVIFDLEKLKELAGDLLPIDIIATLLDADELILREFIADKHSKISKAYHLGKAQTIAAIRKQEIEMAKAGSPFAIENTADYIIEQFTSENG
ncbi:MAG: hypothetical protein VB054_07970 [Petrimonas sp.]|jgi:hypothetical protein|nr:hypothetical protein [Petrimonas sp.]